MAMVLKGNGTINHSVLTVDDLSTISNPQDNDICIVTDKDRGGTFIYRSAEAAVNNGGTVFNGWCREYSDAVNVKWFGVSEDNTKEANTEILKHVINSSHSSLLPNQYGGENILIPSNIKWSANSLINYMSGIISVSNSKTLEGLIITEDMIGCFVWNTTDYSYGVVESYTATSVTVKSLLLGVNNTFTIGDAFVISYMKVGVNIIDESKYSEISNAFTGQIKNFLNSKLPSSYSANEQWAWGQYHTAFIAANHNPSDMEGRASFISRKYNANNKIQSFMQIGLNPLDKTNSNTSPDDASRVLLVGGHNKGIPTNNATSQTFVGFMASSDMLGTYMSIGTHPRTNYSLYQEQRREEANNIGFNAKGLQPTFLKFLNDDVVHDTWRIWGTTGGVSGIRRYTAAKTSNFIIPDSSYSGGHFINTGATGPIAIYVPNIDSSTVGSEFTITVDEAFQISVVPLTGSVIRGATNAIRSSTVGSSVTLVATKVGVYDIIAQTGTWVTS